MGGGEPGALQDLISDFNIYFERHHMMIKGWRGAVVSLVRYNLNCYRSQGEGILKGGKNRKDELVTYIYCGLFNVQNLNDGSENRLLWSDPSFGQIMASDLCCRRDTLTCND